jgi:hypothetical protein
MLNALRGMASIAMLAIQIANAGFGSDYADFTISTADAAACSGCRKFFRKNFRTLPI